MNWAVTIPVVWLGWGLAASVMFGSICRAGQT